MATTTLRAAGVGTGTLLLCLLGGGVAAADTLPAPTTSTLASTTTAVTTSPDQLPSPSDLVDTVTSTVDQVVTTVGSVAGSPAKTPTQTPEKQPTAPTSTPTRHPASTPAAHTTTTPSTLGAWDIQSASGMSALLPSLPSLPTDWAAPAVQAPTLAAAPPTTLVPASSGAPDVAARLADVDRGRSGGALRALLLGLAAAAAGGLATGHVRLARAGR